MDPDKLIKDLEKQLQDRLERLRQDFLSVRTNRPSPEMIENILVPYFEQQMPIKQLASLSIRPPREIVIQVWDTQAIPAVMKAIEEAKLGLSIQREEQSLRAFLPPLTDERRVELGRLVKKMAEETKIVVRALRDEDNKKLKAAESGKLITQDQLFKVKEKIQITVDQANKQIDDLLEKKITDLAS